MDLIQPGIMRQIVDEGVLGVNNGGAGDLTLIWQLGLTMIGLVLFGGMCGSLNNVFTHMAAQNIGNEMRKDALRNVMRFSFPQVDQFGTGSLVTRVTNDVTQVQNFISTFIRGMIRTGMLTFGSIYFMFRLNHNFGLIVLCALPFAAGCIVWCLRKANPMFTELQTQLDRLNAIMQEDVSGIRIIKACVREVSEKIRFGKANEELITTQLQVLMIFAFMNPVINAAMYLVIACLLWVGSYQVSVGETTPGTIMAAITYATQLLSGVMMLVMLFQNISRGYASWKRLREILYAKPDLKDGAFSGQTASHGTVEFRNVSFAYPESGQEILSNINLTIRAGETVAIMGATGCGKTSLVNLIPRFYDVTEGKVLVDGVDVRAYSLHDLREKVAMTLQKSELFSTSIAENIAWGKQDADEETICKAARVAQAHDFIMSQADGYHTQVAERGMSLSGGQRQRISIARAIIKDAEILIFDDSTSALDLTTEAALYRALNDYRPDVTKIIIAQRIASIRRADRIIVLENGHVAASGKHEELLTSCKVYRDIYDSQMGEEAIDRG